VKDHFEARSLEVTGATDSDGDETYVFEAVISAEPEPAPP
jgi:hypothetical protein